MDRKLCMNCMQPLAEEDTVCPHCRYATDKHNPQGYLPAGTALSDHYMVGRALGSYGDACIYAGYDKLLKERVYIREFFPADFCERTRGGGVVPVAGKEEAFDTCRESFLANVRALAKLKELPSLLPLYDIFTENDTVYAISDYCEGVSLARELKTRGRIPFAELRPLFMQLLSSLSTLHRAGVYHLAICPDTILIAPDGKLRLRSFAIPQARTTGSPIKPRLSAGFSAPEQYAPKKTCGEAADVYGVAATLFCALTGNTPPEAPQRARGAQDLFLPADVAEELPENVGLALFNALQPDPDKRIGTIEEFRQALTAEPAVNALLEDEEDENEVAEKPAEKKNHYPLYIGITVFVVLAVLAGILLMVLFPKTPAPSPSDTTPSTVSTAPSKAPVIIINGLSEALRMESIRPAGGRQKLFHRKGQHHDRRFQAGSAVYAIRQEQGKRRHPVAGAGCGYCRCRRDRHQGGHQHGPRADRAAGCCRLAAGICHEIPRSARLQGGCADRQCFHL